MQKRRSGASTAVQLNEERSGARWRSGAKRAQRRQEGAAAPHEHDEPNALTERTDSAMRAHNHSINQG